MRSTAAATSRSQSAGTETSAATCTALPPAARMTSSVGSPPVMRIAADVGRAARRTRPRRAGSRSARPIPDAAPVTTALRWLMRSPFLRSYTDAMPGVAFVAHCLLNQNSKCDGGARCPGDLLAARRRPARAGLAHRADALPRARVHGPAPLLDGQEQARHAGLPAPLPLPGAGRRGRRSPRISSRGHEVAHHRPRGQSVDGRAHHLLERRLGRAPRCPGDSYSLVPGPRRLQARSSKAELHERGMGDVAHDRHRAPAPRATTSPVERQAADRVPGGSVSGR